MARAPQPGGERDELLLDAVVQVTLDAAPLLVLDADEPLARAAQFLGLLLDLGQPLAELGFEPEVAQRQRGLARELRQQLMVALAERVARPLAARQHADELLARDERDRRGGGPARSMSSPSSGGRSPVSASPGWSAAARMSAA